MANIGDRVLFGLSDNTGVYGRPATVIALAGASDELAHLNVHVLPDDDSMLDSHEQASNQPMAGDGLPVLRNLVTRLSVEQAASPTAGKFWYPLRERLGEERAAPKTGRPFAFSLGGMKRVHLDPLEVRPAAVALLRFAVNDHKGRKTGDPVHDWITENRMRDYERALAQKQPWALAMQQNGGYQSCGDLAHWLLTMLGCRDERYVNRTGDEGTVPWRAGQNLSRLVSLPAYQPCTVQAFNDSPPQPGDILYVAKPEHVFVMTDMDRKVTKSITGGHYGQPHGLLRTQDLRVVGPQVYVANRTLRGWVRLDAVALTESACVPDRFEGGIEDDNPYLDDLGAPAEEG